MAQFFSSTTGRFFRLPAAALLILCAQVAGCAKPNPAPAFVTDVPWALSERRLRTDLHVHTRFSTGAETVAALADRARANGCHALALTDHANPGTRTASEQYFAALKDARATAQFPILIAGLDWAVPPATAQARISILVQPALEPLLREFRQRYELGSAADGLRWLGAQRTQAHDVIAVVNHPLQFAAGAADLVSDYTAWHGHSDVVAALEGGPGSQRSLPRGNYTGAVSTMDGWDPAIAEIGGAWDQLLDRGLTPWAALANSGFNSAEHDYAPCEYASTHVLVPQIDADGVLAGLRAGAFWAQISPFLDALDFRVDSPGLVVPAVPGEAFRLGTPQPLTATLRVTRRIDNANLALEATLIGNAANGMPAEIATQRLAPDEEVAAWTIEQPRPGADGASAYLRVRVRAINAGADNPTAYANPVRVFLPAD